jgi:hypothetical protein
METTLESLGVPRVQLAKTDGKQIRNRVRERDENVNISKIKLKPKIKNKNK